MFELTMPKMGESVAEATITEWLKKEANEQKRTISSQFEVICENKMEQDNEPILRSD